jgi:hypothetical protein
VGEAGHIGGNRKRNKRTRIGWNHLTYPRSVVPLFLFLTLFFVPL